MSVSILLKISSFFSAIFAGELQSQFNCKSQEIVTIEVGSEAAGTLENLPTAVLPPLNILKIHSVVEIAESRE